MQGEKSSLSPLLEYDRLVERWEGETTSPEGNPILVWMEDATLQRYVDAYVLTHYKEPTLEQRREAIMSLRNVSYWLSLQVPDPNVHIRRFGRCSRGGEQGGQ